jgi:hypothetical protein
VILRMHDCTEVCNIDKWKINEFIGSSFLEVIHCHCIRIFDQRMPVGLWILVVW